MHGTRKFTKGVQTTHLKRRQQQCEHVCASGLGKGVEPQRQVFFQTEADAVRFELLRSFRQTRCMSTAQHNSEIVVRTQGRHCTTGAPHNMQYMDSYAPGAGPLCGRWLCEARTAHLTPPVASNAT